MRATNVKPGIEWSGLMEKVSAASSGNLWIISLWRHRCIPVFSPEHILRIFSSSPTFSISHSVPAMGAVCAEEMQKVCLVDRVYCFLHRF